MCPINLSWGMVTNGFENILIDGEYNTPSQLDSEQNLVPMYNFKLYTYH